MKSEWDYLEESLARFSKAIRKGVKEMPKLQTPDFRMTVMEKNLLAHKNAIEALQRESEARAKQTAWLVAVACLCGLCAGFIGGLAAWMR